jgi:hypothetical protein
MKRIIEIIKEDYETIPFHNFRIILKKDMNIKLGGTCSDRTLYLRQKLDSSGIKTNLHSAKINGKDIHRLLKINREPYFLDVGLGWPLMQPISLTQNMNFNFFGLYFKTKIIKNQISVYKLNKGIYNLNYTSQIDDINSEIVEKQINDRFNNIEDYPFKDSIRFSKVVDNEFYFLKGNILGYSNNNKFQYKTINTKEEFISLFENIFKFNIDLAIEVAKKTNMYEFL